MSKILVPEDRTLKVHKFSCMLDVDPFHSPHGKEFEVRDKFVYSHILDRFRRKCVSEARVRRLLMQHNCIHVDDETYRVEKVFYEDSETEEVDVRHEKPTFLEFLQSEKTVETRPVVKEKMMDKGIESQIYPEE